MTSDLMTPPVSAHNDDPDDTRPALVHTFIIDPDGATRYVTTFTDCPDPDLMVDAVGNSYRQSSAGPYEPGGADEDMAAAHVFVGDPEHPEYHKLGAVPNVIARHASNDQPTPLQPILPTGDAEQTRAALFTAIAWQHITQAAGLRPAILEYAHIPGAFDPAFLRELALPTRGEVPDGQLVALDDGICARYPDHAARLAAYLNAPRTWVFELVHRTVPWLSHATAYLARLSGSRLEVIAGLYDSHTADDACPLHWDDWYSLIIQLDGAKQWTIGPDRQQITTTPGDILLIPRGLAHAVTTPPDPGHSRHLAISLCRNAEYTLTAPSGNGKPEVNPDTLGHWMDRDSSGVLHYVSNFTGAGHHQALKTGVHGTPEPAPATIRNAVTDDAHHAAA